MIMPEQKYLDARREACFVDEAPEYGENYRRGFLFFTSRLERGVVSRGIAWFTRFDRLGAISVTHTGLVTGPGMGIEAEIGKGVAEVRLSEYFDDPRVAIFFRKPRGLSVEDADIMVNAAMSQIGKRYDKRLLGAHALMGSYLGRLASLVTGKKSDAFIAWLLDNPQLWICSEFMSWVLDHVGRFAGHGVLRFAPATINPQELFEDEVIFERWKSGGVYD